MYPAAVAAAPPESRLPCPDCGSSALTIDLYASSSITVHTQVAIKARRPGMSRPLIEVKDGDDLHRDTGRWMRLRRRIDRQRSPAWYDERIVDAETCEVVRERSEPLSDHVGRGSARRAGDVDG